MSPSANSSAMPSPISLSQSQFHHVLDALPDATFVVNRSGEIIYASIKTKATYGYQPEELIGQKVETLVPEVYRKNHVNYRQGYFDNPMTRLPGNGLEFQGQRKDGSVFPAEISLSHIETEQGVLAICTVRDISERKITEKLLINDERFQLLLQNAPAAIAMFDRDMRYLAVSKRWQDEYGPSDQNLIGRSHYDVFPQIPDEWKVIHRRCLAGETLRAEEDSFRQLNGQLDWLRWEMRPWYNNDGSIGGAVLFSEVITQRKQAEIELQKITEKFRILFDNAVMGIAVGELETGKLHLYNRAYCQLLGYEYDELKDVSFKTLVHPDDMALQTAAVERLSSEGLASVIVDNRYINKRGDPVWVRKIIQKFPSNPGDPLLLMATVMDYTAVKQAEAMQQAYLENLESQIKERTLALEKAVEQAERADKVKSTFLTAASHDLRQPLQSAGLFLSVLAEMNNAPQHREICEAMRLSLETMSSLLSGLLDISRFQSGMVVPEISDFSLAPLLDRMVTNNLQQARNKGLKLAVKSVDCCVRSDPALLERILENLVTNAIRYTQEGYIVISCECSDEAVRISVSDTGIGIPASELDSIFDEYYQLANPGRDRRKGLGLGLAIVKHIAKILGHSIEVQSVPEQGSVFTVTAPLGHDLQQGSAATHDLPAGAGEHPKLEVLFIDDDPQIVMAMKLLFAKAGFLTHTADSAENAYTLIHSGVRPDIIVSDYRLPGSNGMEAVKHIRDLVVDTIPAIILSGDTSLNQIEAGHLPLAEVFLKPVDAQKLIAAILKMATIYDQK